MFVVFVVAEMTLASASINPGNKKLSGVSSKPATLPGYIHIACSEFDDNFV